MRVSYLQKVTRKSFCRHSECLNGSAKTHRNFECADKFLRPNLTASNLTGLAFCLNLLNLTRLFARQSKPRRSISANGARAFSWRKFCRLKGGALASGAKPRSNLNTRPRKPRQAKHKNVAAKLLAKFAKFSRLAPQILFYCLILGLERGIDLVHAF